ncbi:MAG: dipeptidyl aminopeptidase/acylaminoacyl peptidase [Granulosicoccus sp.]
MTLRKTSPYGSWPSPITANMLVSGATGISEVVPDGQSVWWAESRPSEGGRVAIMHWQNGNSQEVTPTGANVRTTMHEYGGGAWWAENGVLWYVDYSDQRLRQLDLGKDVEVISAEPETAKALRYADMRPTRCGQWLISVHEKHSDITNEPQNLLIAVATNSSGNSIELAMGADFYGSPALSPNGKELAWVQWDHPNMPWDDTTLMLADIDISASSIELKNCRAIAGGKNEAIVQPAWSPSGKLHYLSDKSDLWHLYVQGNEQPILETDGEIGYPPWVHGLSRYGFLADGSVVFANYNNGIDHLDGYADQTNFQSIRTSGSAVSFTSASWSSEASVFFNGNKVRGPRDLQLHLEYLTEPEILTFPTGADKEDVAYAIYYAPAHPEMSGPTDDKPPLIVLAHGGPTSAARSQLSLPIRFWTSRGFAVVDVNYRGSSGFGRAYRKKLDGNWGIADVEDCVCVAQYLVERGDVDPQRLIIRGGSAGGFTVLSALAFHDTFTAGASMYGVADLEALANDTHKFESRYLDGLIGPWPQAADVYKARSPINHVEGFDAPMIILQGSEDAIVPPNQSRMIVDALDKRGIPVAYIEFEGEQHGFRQADSIMTAIQSELAFYGRVFGFIPDGDPTPLEIRNLD